MWEAERRRIARHLQDEALRDLTDALAEAAHPGPAAVGPQAADLDRLVPVLTRAGQHLRLAIFDLHLGSDESEPFADLLRSLVDIHGAMAVDCDVALQDGDTMTDGSLGETGMSSALSARPRPTRGATRAPSTSASASRARRAGCGPRSPTTGRASIRRWRRLGSRVAGSSGCANAPTS
jgi:hypothetical protein